MHELGRTELAVRRKELLSRFIALTILIIAIYIPTRITRVCVLAEDIRHIGKDKLRFRYAIDFVVLKAIVKQIYIYHNILNSIFLILFSITLIDITTSEFE